VARGLLDAAEAPGHGFALEYDSQADRWRRDRRLRSIAASTLEACRQSDAVCSRRSAALANDSLPGRQRRKRPSRPARWPGAVSPSAPVRSIRLWPAASSLKGRSDRGGGICWWCVSTGASLPAHPQGPKSRRWPGEAFNTRWPTANSKSTGCARVGFPSLASERAARLCSVDKPTCSCQPALA